MDKGVQHDGRLPFWKPAVCTLCSYCNNVFAIGEINIIIISFPVQL